MSFGLNNIDAPFFEWDITNNTYEKEYTSFRGPKTPPKMNTSSNTHTIKHLDQATTPDQVRSVIKEFSTGERKLKLKSKSVFSGANSYIDKTGMYIRKSILSQVDVDITRSTMTFNGVRLDDKGHNAEWVLGQLQKCGLTEQQALKHLSIFHQGVLANLTEGLYLSLSDGCNILPKKKTGLEHSQFSMTAKPNGPVLIKARVLFEIKATDEDSPLFQKKPYAKVDGIVEANCTKQTSSCKVAIDVPSNGFFSSFFG